MTDTTLATIAEAYRQAAKSDKLTSRLCAMLPDQCVKPLALVQADVEGNGYYVWWFHNGEKVFKRTILPDLTEEWAAWLILQMP